MDEEIVFRKATAADSGRIWQIILQAKEQMRLRGSRQWQDGYPDLDNIMHDIESGCGYVLYSDHDVIAYGAIIFDGEPAYNSIDGAWLTDLPYVVVHRLAVAEEVKRQGIAALFMRKVEELSFHNGIYSFRVDTNFDNSYMQKILLKMNFTYCGEIMYESGKRMAYEKINTGYPKQGM
ncbi:MAG: GNAT family N-acetyltransferase [Dysgonamonadaceae bacterium]|jgi:GNAT superfamily N-acetyltransferase|nr:GNAT family N-acetyltransferase [Dysgonamonadaceae bacterium]